MRKEINHYIGRQDEMTSKRVQVRKLVMGRCTSIRIFIQMPKCWT